MVVCHSLIIYGILRDMPLFVTCLIVIFLIFYQFGAGPLPYVYLTDICGDTGMSVGVISMWIWILVTTFVSPFLLMNKNIGVVPTFVGEAIFTVMGFLFCLLVLKETKSLTDQECKNLFNPKQKSVDSK